MDTRINKYNDTNNMSRVSKNGDLYKKINEGDLDNFSVRSNAMVIGNQDREIDIEQIKKILDKRYNNAPKRRSIRVEPVERESKISEEATKEYDLNIVLEKAKDEKQDTYEENRAKKLRNTQFDILNNLNINSDKSNDESSKNAQEDLMELINTITINEAKKKEEDKKNDSDPLDILTDLKGTENTQVYESMEKKITSISEIKEKNDIEELGDSKIDNSFYTSNLFNKKDFEDEDNKDFVEDSKTNLGIKILIFLIAVVFIVGLVVFLKSFLKL